MGAVSILNLKESGFTEAQLRALAEHFDDNISTRSDIATVRAELDTRFSKFEIEIKEDIAAIKDDLKDGIDKIKTHVAAAKVSSVKTPAKSKPISST